MTREHTQMQLFQENDKSKAICEHCKKIVLTTFKRRAMSFSDGKGLAQNILVSICDSCDRVVGIPAQSTPAIREARKKETRSLEANLPAIYVDLLDLIAYTLNKDCSTDSRRSLLLFYLMQLSSTDTAVKRIKQCHKEALLEFPERRGTDRRRLSMKVSMSFDRDFRNLSTKSKLNASDILKSVVFAMKIDLIDKPKNRLLKTMRDVVSLSA